MEPIKELKRKGRHTLRTHYFLLVILCLVAVIWGGEFASSGNLSSANSTMDTSNTSSVLLLDSNSENVFVDIIGNKLQSGKTASDTAFKDYQSGEDSTKVLGRTRGVLAHTVNTVTSGKLYMKIASGVYSITKSGKAVAVIFTIVSMLFYLSIWVFAKKIYTVIMRRMFLEARVYDRVPLQNMLHLLSVRKWCKASLSMFLCTIFQFLWSLTIIGGFIKVFSYYAVPYILAENPGIDAGEAITLSRKMMYGHKMECFKYHLAFIHWYILSFLTAGIVGILYFYPYKTATFTEYYSHIREMAKAAGIENSDKLNDTYLFEKAGSDTLKTEYADIINEEEQLSENRITLTPLQAFMAKYLGLWIGRTKTKRLYQKDQNIEYKIHSEKYELSADAYPTRLDPLYTGKKFRIPGKDTFLRCYTVWSLALMFFLFSFLGWCWEVSLHFINYGVFVNRGTLFGPWLPIYGSGAILVLVLLSSLKKHPVGEFFGAIILCGIVEYGTSYFLQAKYNMRWWDYTGYFLNINGRICAEGLLVFAIAGMLVVYLIAPALDSFLSKMDTRKAIPICACLMILFSIDAVHSIHHPNTGKGVTSYSAYKQSSATAMLSYDEARFL